MSINETIADRLSALEKKENVRILHCVESGSRAWGFPSPDSDYDVRFIYAREPEFYLRLDKTRDVIEWELNDVLDINGWDISKALRLLHKSNPTLFEWDRSPIIYKTTAKWQSVKELIGSCFRTKQGLYHYISTAKTNYREYLKTEEVRLKKYFYVLRPILACKWIINRNSPPPMLFSELMETELEPPMTATVKELLSLKMNTPELGTGRRIDEINEYIEKSFEEIYSFLSNCPDEAAPGWEALNAAFLRIIGGK